MEGAEGRGIMVKRGSEGGLWGKKEREGRDGRGVTK